MVRVLGASLLAAVAAVQLAVCDRDAGTLYGAPLVGQSVRALRQWSSSGRGPIVISDRVGEQIFPMLGRRPEGLLFSHEVGPDQIERWRRTGGFGFMDLHPTSPLRHPHLNPVLGWRHGLPASARHVERLVESLLWAGRRGRAGSCARSAISTGQARAAPSSARSSAIRTRSVGSSTARTEECWSIT